MQATTLAPSPGDSTVWRRAAPLLCGCTLAASATYLAINDPAAAGSRFPACQFRAMTGLWCPGCGLTRGTHELLHGHLGAALGHNIFVPLVLLAVVTAWLSWSLSTWGRRLPLPGLVATWSSRWVTVAVPVVVLAYGVLRNIPAEPFRVLAP